MCYVFNNWKNGYCFFLTLLLKVKNVTCEVSNCLSNQNASWSKQVEQKKQNEVML